MAGILRNTGNRRVARRTSNESVSSMATQMDFSDAGMDSPDRVGPRSSQVQMISTEGELSRFETAGNGRTQCHKATSSSPTHHIRIMCFGTGVGGQMISGARVGIDLKVPKNTPENSKNRSGGKRSALARHARHTI